MSRTALFADVAEFQALEAHFANQLDTLPRGPAATLVLIYELASGLVDAWVDELLLAARRPRIGHALRSLERRGFIQRRTLFTPSRPGSGWGDTAWLVRLTKAGQLEAYERVQK